MEEFNKHENTYPDCICSGVTLNNSIKAFTLAETMIVVVVLGLVAAITVPAVVKRHAEMEKRMKIKKNMTVYDHAINKMVIENGIKNEPALIDYAGDNCKNSTTYFNKTDGNGCVFKTSDGVWWDISTITKPKIAFNQDDLNGDVNIPKSFGFYAWFDSNNSLRVDDLEAMRNNTEANPDELANLENLYKYLAGKKIEATVNGEQGNPESDFVKNCKSGVLTCNKVTIPEDAPSIDQNVWGEHLCKWDSETNQQDCTYVSTAEPGEYYFLEPATYKDYQSYLDEESSTCTSSGCQEFGDNYNAAKRYCEAQGGRLPTVAELQASGLANSGGYFWASEEHNSGNAYGIGFGIDYSDKSGENDVACVGK